MALINPGIVLGKTMAYQSEIHFTSDKLSGFERLRVDNAQTGFFEGREFRTYKELNIAGAATYVVKAVVPINIILMSLSANIDSGGVRIGTYVGGTPGGVFAETLPIIPANNMSLGTERRRSFSGVGYTVQTVLTAGGTHTGGTELDVLRARAAGNQNQGGTVGVAEDSSRGIAANTYYFRLLNLSATDVATGVFMARWEERPVEFFLPSNF